MTPILSINNLSVQFNNYGEPTRAVRNISLNVSAGELVAIVGESGSGKSVTALSILQLLPKNAVVTGDILFHQKETTNLAGLSYKGISRIRGNKISMIFQEPMTSLNPVFTCGYQVMEAIQQHQKLSKKVALQKTIELFEKVELPDPQNIVQRYPHELSGGQKQRVMIAMAMSCNPALLVADEPTTALDVTVQKTILELIRSLQVKNNMAVIFITHDLAIVAEIADKILVMYKGEIAEQGNAKDILSNPKHPYTKALLACRPDGSQKGKPLPVVADFIETETKANKNPLPGNTKPENLSVQPAGSTDGTKIPALKVENLSVHFAVKKNVFGKVTEYFTAVDDVSFTVNQGDIIGLVGESGCGKTTVGRSILQLIKPTSGKIWLHGQDLTRLNPEALRRCRRNLQIVFQDPYGSLDPRMTIGNAILEPMKVNSILANNDQRIEKVMDLLEKVNLNSSQFYRYPHQLSGGQRQRVCIARALALNPAFLIFDESVSALDVSVQAQVLNLLQDLKKEFDFTAIFISHDLSVVHYICNRIMVMYQGKIVEDGDAGDIYYHPKNEYTKKLMNAIPGKILNL